ncbi:WbqC family protein [Guyparkeria hydrothermalis]|uniref:WbqC family protein n=1 Tax=Guyparkeria hydrothermalis TaxID=923 RepID=UPI00202244AE|nr:WbqC family protein [Guyparkeria hydrothermalis]MCL7743680.1 WbqC family protein [Guyparkeria hydrothermalis]
MRLAVMQPYLFPYIGYFQLIYSADLFLIYDDVSYIKQGYINRNSILSPNGPVRITIPVPGASSNKLISELQFSVDVVKVLKTIEQSYCKAPYFDAVFPMIRKLLEQGDRSIASLCLNSYQVIFSYLGINQQFKKTSELDYDRTLSAQDRLIAFCHKFGADCYINAPGGRSLYSESDFAEQGVDLKFVDSLPVEYPQGNHKFVANLSIIDMLMNCSPKESINLLKQYELS